MIKKQTLWIGAIVLFGLCSLYAVIVPMFVVRTQSPFIKTGESVTQVFDRPIVGIVFGAGIHKDGTPSNMLQDRLDTAAQLYTGGVIGTILVSGDNSAKDYDEPTAMFRYLVDTAGIPEKDVVRDHAGRRTYDTCARAHTIWGIDHAVLVTQQYHLPRALFTCRAAGIQSVGVSASLQPYLGGASRLVREFFAIHMSVVDNCIFPPHFIGGKQERDLDID